MMLRALMLLAAVFLDCRLARAASDRDRFLRSNLDKIPLIKLERSNIPFAKVHELSPPSQALEFKGMFFSGFRFTVPEWLDGYVHWMNAYEGPETEVTKTSRWFVIPEEDEGDDYRYRYALFSWPGRPFPEFLEQFPNSSFFTIHRLNPNSFKPGKNYIVCFSFSEKERPKYRFALNVRSDRGLQEFGILPTGMPYGGVRAAFRRSQSEPAKDPHKIAGEATTIYRGSGKEAALAFLERETDAYLAAGANFYDFYYYVWKEAQVGHGRIEREWAADCFSWLQKKSQSLGAIDLSQQLAPNTAGSLMAANRYGAAHQALAPLFEGMKRRTISLDPSILQDLGPGIPSLPEIRNRKIPMESPIPIGRIEYAGEVDGPHDMPKGLAGSLSSLATLEAHAGNWKTALERYLWTCSWCEAKRGEIDDLDNSWYTARIAMAGLLSDIGLFEASDAEYATVLAKGWPDIYHDRSLNQSRFSRIGIKVELKQPDESMLGALDALVKNLKRTPLATRRTWENAEIIKARCLSSLGRAEEADKLLSTLVEGNNRHALIARIQLRLKANRLDGLEEELISVLESSREWGKKIEEAKIYSLYADFLEESGRLDESLAMRREAIRLMKGFDLFALLPTELAHLSATLTYCGDESGAKLVADEARALIAKRERIPERISKQVSAILEAAASRKPVTVDEKKALVDLQPQRAVVIPIEGKPVRGRLTLANPSSQAVEGTLGFDGMPVEVSFDASTGETFAKLGTNGGLDRVNKLRVDPGSYVQIQLSAEAASLPKGELTVWWSSPGQDDRKSLWTFDTAEEGVSSAVIDAGEFKRNAFYGVPIHHHYLSASGTLSTLRAVTSVPARVEFYDASDKPVYVDMNGNGNLAESGDSIFADGNADGNPDIATGSGEAALRLQVFPAGDIPSEGVKVSVEALVDGKWLPFSEDRIVP